MKILFTVSILLLMGCTITKRHFGPGYHVEWKKSVSKTKNEVDRLNITDSERESSMIPDENKMILKEMISTDTMHHTEAISPDQLEVSIEEPADFSETPVQSEIKPLIESDQISDEEVPVDEPKRRVEPFTWVALAGIIVGFLLVLVSFLASSPEMILSIALFIGIGVIVSSIISVVRIHRNPDSYKGKGLSWTLFGLSTVGIGAVLFAIVYAILLLTGSVGFL